MCVAIAIKYNEWKVLEVCSKFWCVVILNTLSQHTACQGCKTSSNRLLNILPLHSYTPWLPYIKPGPQHAKAKCVRDYMARSKIGQRYIFIRGRVDLRASVCECVQINGLPPSHIYKCLCVMGRGKVQSITQLKLCVTVTGICVTDGWTKSSQVCGFKLTTARCHSRAMINKPRSRWVWPTRPQKTFTAPSLPPPALGLHRVSHAALKAPTVGEAQGI